MARLIQRSVDGAVEGEREVGVAFSGGLDSSTVARCAARRVRVTAFSLHAPGSRDSVKAKEAAEAMDIPLVAGDLTGGAVRTALSEIDLPFTPTLMDRSLWCLYRLVSQSANRAGARVLLLGQLADELFGGYAKYAEALKERGEAAAESMMNSDVREYEVRGKVRDFAACGGLVEPRLPFGAREVVEFAGTLPLSFKIRGGEKKAVLRRAAVVLGVPSQVADAPKKAAQYSSGVQKLVNGSHF